jgi:hypothetical protein
MSQNFLDDEGITVPFKPQTKVGTSPSYTFLIGGGAEKVITFLQHFTKEK